MEEEEKKELEEELEQHMKLVLKFALKGAKDLLSDEELPKVIARFTKRFFDALKAEGFTDQQALEIVTRMQFPNIPSVPKT